jgi:hypothetical protein
MPSSLPTHGRHTPCPLPVIRELEGGAETEAPGDQSVEHCRSLPASSFVMCVDGDIVMSTDHSPIPRRRCRTWSDS